MYDETRLEKVAQKINTCRSIYARTYVDMYVPLHRHGGKLLLPGSKVSHAGDKYIT